MAKKANEELTLDGALAGLPEEFGFFADRYRNQIQPQLAGREADRVAAVKRQQTFTIYGVLAALVPSVAGFWFFQSPFGAFLGLVAGFGVYAWGSQPLNKLAKETKLMLVEPVSAQFGMAFDAVPPSPSEIMEFRGLGLVPGWDRSSFEDQLIGQRGEAPFKFFEAHLEEKRTTTDSKGNTRTTWVTVFRGQCLVAKFHKEFNGVTKVFRDAGFFNALTKLGQKGQRVKLEDPVFEKAFEVYSTDQIEARFILTPDFMERLQKLEKTFQGKQLRCAFAGGQMLLAVEGKNQFEPGSMYRPMDDLNRVRDILHDFAAVFLLIDAMSNKVTPQSLRPDGVA